MIYFAIGILIGIMVLPASYAYWLNQVKLDQPEDQKANESNHDNVIYRSTGAYMAFPDGRTPRGNN